MGFVNRRRGCWIRASVKNRKFSHGASGAFDSEHLFTTAGRTLENP
jgi:hypothetical protein